jgi:hypothetical protein
MQAGLLGGITWDPFIRGVVILAVFIVVLPGSVYLLLATNTGARLALLLTAAGLTGFMFILAILWMVLSSTADVGRVNSWRPLQIVTGDFQSQVTVRGSQNFPIDAIANLPSAPKSLRNAHWYWPLQSCPVDDYWHKENPAKLTDTESAADKVLVPSSTGGPTRSQLTTPFTLATDYVYIDGFEKGANGGCLFAIKRHKIYLPLGRGPHYVIMRVQPALPQPATSTAKAQPDTSKPYTYVILERDLGSVREPQLIMAVVMGLLFLILCDTLHRRDKEIARRRAAPDDGPGGGGGPGGAGTGGGGSDVEGAREPVGAST